MRFTNRTLRSRLLRTSPGDGGPGAGGGGATPPAGGTGTGTGTGTGSGQQPTTGTNGEDQLGDAGKKAIAEERKAKSAAEQRAKAAEEELEKIRSANQSEAEKALDKARKEGRTEATTQSNARLVRAEVKAAAATAQFNDPGDAVAQLHAQLATVKVSDDGDVDEAAVKALIEQLAKDKPYLLKKPGTASPSDAGIGAGGGSAATRDAQPGLDRMRLAYETSGKK